jgi:hypothetical protein
MSNGFLGSNVHASEFNGIVKDEAFFLLFKDSRFKSGDGVWKIERCSPSSNTCCSTIQRNLMKHCNAVIITKITNCGIPSPCYNGLWFNLKRSTPICHKFWFCANVLTHCVGRTRRKYHVNKPFVPSTWPMQGGLT